jgi:DNA-directed RNA polymerase specialized sigma24 family protein
MGEADWLAERFKAQRPRLRAVAYQMLGSGAEADAALQEAWLRLSRSDTSAVENMSGWLTTIVARVCLDPLRSRQSRREQPADRGSPTDSPWPTAPSLTSTGSRTAAGSPSSTWSSWTADLVGQALCTRVPRLSAIDKATALVG